MDGKAGAGVGAWGDWLGRPGFKSCQAASSPTRAPEKCTNLRVHENFLFTSQQHLETLKAFVYDLSLESPSQAVRPTEMNPNPRKSSSHKRVHSKGFLTVKMIEKWLK